MQANNDHLYSLQTGIPKFTSSATYSKAKLEKQKARKKLKNLRDFFIKISILLDEKAVREKKGKESWEIFEIAQMHDSMS